MGISYGLTCIECGETYHLGKSHRISTRLHDKETFGFSSIGACDEPTQKHAFFLIGLQHFLLRHRQHELRVFGDNLAVKNDGICWFDDFDCGDHSLRDLLRQEIGVPNPDSESRELDPAILERLEKGGERAEKRFPVKGLKP